VDTDDVLIAFREELVATGRFRKASIAGGAAVYPIHVEPQEGPPAPGEREAPEDNADLVVSLMLSTTAGEAPFDSAWRHRPIIDVRFRSKGPAVRTVFELEKVIRARLIRPETNYGHGFVLGTAAPIFCQQATLFGGLSPIGRSRAAGYDHVAKWMLEVPPA
jgi:hypothetical protein